MKRIVLTAFLFLLSFLRGAGQTSPCNCITCDTVINTVVNGNLSVSPGKTLCITASGVVNGNISVTGPTSPGNGGAICNEGTINGNISLTWFASMCNSGKIESDSIIVGFYKCSLTNHGTIKAKIKIDQEGIVDNHGKIYGSISLPGYAARLNNHGYAELENLDIGAHSYVVNGGILTVKNPVIPGKSGSIENTGCTVFNKNFDAGRFGPAYMRFHGRTFIDGSLKVTNNNMVDVNGYLEIRDTLSLLAVSKLKLSPGSCVKAKNLIIINSSSIDGMGPGYSQVIIAGSAEGRENSYITGMVDICLTGNPGSKPNIPNIDPTVTFCSNNPNCSASRCDSTSSQCTSKITATTTGSGCSGTVGVSATGGTEPYTYQWSNGQTTATVSGLSPGTYTVTITDASGICSATAAASVTAAHAVSLTSTHPVCNGSPYGSINSTVTGGTPPYTYQWSNGETTANLSFIHAGSYTVTVTDASGCSVSASEYVKPSVASPIIVMNGNTLYVVPDDTSKYEYLWYLDNQPVLHAKGSSYTPNRSGIYKVYVVDIANKGSETPCAGMSPGYEVVLTGIETTKHEDIHLTVAPNPGKGIFSIYFSTSERADLLIEIYNIVGEKILSLKQISADKTNKVDIDISQYSRGLYLLDVKDTKGSRSVIKIIRE